jgi:hypothetical protein
MAFNVYEWRRNQLITENEEESTVVTKKIKDLTFKDVEGLALPTKTATIFANMKLDHNLDSWRKAFSKEEQELEVTIDKDNKMWSDKVKIEGITQSDPMGFQAKIDAEKGKKSGLDEMQGEEYDEDTVNPNDYADNPGYNDKVAFLVGAFEYVWGMGKGNNTINFKGMAESTIEDLETRF